MRTIGGPFQVARSETCPALRELLTSFRNLPDLKLSPPSISPPPLGLPIEPTKKDGSSYQFKLEVAVPNGNRSLVSINDYSGDYAIWADGAFDALSHCWGPSN